MSGIPISISNRYMEAGGIKAVNGKTEEFVFVEVWIGSSFDRNVLCPELRNIKRCPLESIIKELVGAGNGKMVCPVFMCDSFDKNCDTLDWGSTLYLVLNAVKERGKLAGAVIYTKCSYARILEDRKNGRFRTLSDDRAFDALFELVDVFITEQPNVYAEGKPVISECGGQTNKLWADTEAIVRISKFERIYNRVRTGSRDEAEICLLKRYLDSGQWLRDYEKDEQGLLPENLKRGVLSQDGLYNLLSEI